MYKLVVVDDEPKIRNGLCSFFPWNEVGFEVVSEAEDGDQALDYILERDVDAVLTDIKMPNMSGIELAMEIFNRKPAVKVVFLSGFKEFEYAQKALMFGVRNYVVKPTRYDELFEVFSKIRLELDRERKGGLSPFESAEQDIMDDTQGFHEKVISTIKAYVNENYADANLEDASDLVHMNYFYLSKYFKKLVGQNFSDYVTSVRMEKAAQMLQDISYKTYEISSLVGYANAKYFSQAFKRYYGVTPKEFRDNPISVEKVRT